APTRAHYEVELADGALYVGSPQTVARKIARTARDLRLSRFDLKYDIMHLPRQARARTIELLGSEVAPRVRELLSDEPARVRPGTAPK
ncbi:LLM class flavin-dependent oxidoreductase, partial [Streptomyces sp. Ru62]